MSDLMLKTVAEIMREISREFSTMAVYMDRASAGQIGLDAMKKECDDRWERINKHKQRYHRLVGLTEEQK
jgi:hypothetical protein